MSEFSAARSTCEQAAQMIGAVLMASGNRSARRRAGADLAKLLGQIRPALVAAAEALREAEELQEEVARLRRRLDQQEPAEEAFLGDDDQSLLGDLT